MAGGESVRYEEAMAALEAVKVKHFTAVPSTIDPFEQSTLSWDVTAPKKSGVSVRFDIEGTPVATSGEFLVAPEASTTYQLTAQALGVSRVVAAVTVEVNMKACVTHTRDGPDFLVTAAITGAINADKSLILITPQDSIVAIQDDRMVIGFDVLKSQKLVGRIHTWFGASVAASFTLGLVAVPGPLVPGLKPNLRATLDPRSFYWFHHLAAENKDISVDAHAPWWLWLVPGAVIALPIALSNAEDQVKKKISDQIDTFVAALDATNFPDAQRPTMDKHDASFYVNPQGDQLCWIRFCPVPAGSMPGLPPVEIG